MFTYQERGMRWGDWGREVAVTRKEVPDHPGDGGGNFGRHTASDSELDRSKC